MTTKRMVQLSVQPLTHVELINALSSKDPIYKEEDDAFLSAFKHAFFMMMMMMIRRGF